MTGITAILLGPDLGKYEWVVTKHIGIDEQRLVASSQVDDMLDLQLHVVQTLDTGEIQSSDTLDQFGTQSIVSAPGIAVSE